MREENYQRLPALSDAQEEVDGTDPLLVRGRVKDLDRGNDDKSKRQDADDRKAPSKQALTAQINQSDHGQRQQHAPQKRHKATSKGTEHPHSMQNALPKRHRVSRSPIEEEQKAEGEHSDERKRVGRCYRAVGTHEGACKHELFDSAYRH